MVNLPAVLAGSFTIEIPTDPGSALVFTPVCGVIIADNLCFLPNSKFGFIVIICHFICFCFYASSLRFYLPHFLAEASALSRGHGLIFLYSKVYLS